MTKIEQIRYTSDLLGAEMKRLRLLITDGVDAELIVSLVNSVIYPNGSIIKAWERMCPRIQQ